MSTVNNCLLLAAENCISELKLYVMRNGNVISENNGAAVVSVIEIPGKNEVREKNFLLFLLNF